MIFGPWNGDFVIARPGETIMYADFKTPIDQTPGPVIPVINDRSQS
jgi:hypothetical protein